MHSIILGVSGSVASYRACDIARELTRAGFLVRICMTDSAKKFVSPALFEALTGQPTLSDVFEEPVPGRMAHIDWARTTHTLLVAPATADILAKLAHGIGDDMLTTIALAFEGTLIVAPAMNPTMFASDRVQHSLKVLEARGAIVVNPTEGDVACGENGQGKLASISAITSACQDTVIRKEALHGKRVLITSGPTREPIDAVRFVSNRSSGKMGLALARAAKMLGAQVTIVSGPVNVVYPASSQVVWVQTAKEMLDACIEIVNEIDIMVGAAAVADYRPASASPTKIRRSVDELTLQLVQNPDIIAELAQKKKPGAIVVGFAAEPTGDLSIARKKIEAKQLNAIAVNAIDQPGIAFDSEENAMTFITSGGSIVSIPKGSKLQCALQLFNEISKLRS